MSNALRLQDQVIAALRRITRAIDLHSHLLLQKHGLTSPQLAALQATQRLQPGSTSDQLTSLTDVMATAATVTNLTRC